MLLSIEKYLDQIRQKLLVYNSILCISPTGSGKSTVLPKYLLSSTDKKIWLLQPRQAAAKMVARRIAELADVNIGKEVGYQVRFDNKTNKNTQLTVMTQGMFLQPRALLPLSQISPLQHPCSA